MKFPWFRRRQHEADFDAETRSNFDEAIRERLARGEAPDEARANALREFAVWAWSRKSRARCGAGAGLSNYCKTCDLECAC